ncbi:MAG: GNAT family N-acetyltransferase [Methanobacteriaceae archaeon]|nr:GNAT family N-acetyltransferase [Methanobacteriaceae archaeon]
MGRSIEIIKKGILIRPFALEDVDFIIVGQLELYEREYGFTSDIWKAYLTDGVHDLVNQFDKEKDCIFILEYNGVPSGCTAIKNVDEGTAKFRFFFLNSELRGLGAGHKLLDMAIDFCRENGYKQVFLWTFSTLKAARHLYKSKGFKIIETQENNEWGTTVLEERWELDLMEDHEK